MEPGSSPYFSIITATLNVGETLRKTCDSLCSQTFQSFEHLVADGESTDSTLEILKEYAAKYRLDWVSAADSGIASALNKLIPKISGKYVLVLHGDDFLLTPEALAQVHLACEREQADIMSFPIVIFDESDSGRIYRQKRGVMQYLKMPIPHQGCFAHKRVYEQVGLFDESFRIAFDYDWMYRVRNAGVSVVQENVPVSAMASGGISGQSKWTRARILEEFRVQKKNEQHPLLRVLFCVYRCGYYPYKMLLNTIRARAR